MRIVFLSYNYSPDINSPEEWLKRLHFYIGWSECLAKNHTVIRIDQINYEGTFTHRGIEYRCVDDGKKINYFPRKLHRQVKDLKPDIIVVSSFRFPLQVIQLRRKLGNQVKIIIQHHAELPFTGLKRYLQRSAGKRANAFLFTAYETGAEWVRTKNLDTVRKIHELMEVSSLFYPIDKKIARDKTKVSGSPAFLWVSRLNQNKDPVTAVNAFLRFAERQPAAKLYMIYHTEELISEIRKLLPPQNSPVLLIGKLDHNELLFWFNSADFYLSASHYESGGTALCEAMSCGCIPVVTNIPSFRTISGDAGLFFQPGNEEVLLSRLLQTTGFPADEKKQYAIDRFRTKLSFEAIADRFQEIADSL
jgi:glycosyltransferase involved in cell wall biosynthesis